MNNIKKHKKSLFECVIENASIFNFSDNFFSMLAVNSGMGEAEIMMLFPGNLKQFVCELERYCDYLAIKKNNCIKVRDKIKQEILNRLRLGDKKHINLLSMLQDFYMIPSNYNVFLETTWSSADNIWKNIGDKSTDFNYYTKRLILSTVYKSTLCYYLRDKSKSYKNTLDFLDNAIEKVMTIGKIKRGSNLVSRLKNKIPFIRLIKV
jgi:ubiquinone biosynthesis protein COQ9